MPVWKDLSLSRLGTRAVLWILASSLSAVALGQDTTADVPDTNDTADEVVAPERVARLSFTQGGVSLQAVGETTWAPATLNRPLTPGDFLRTEADGRAEVQVGSADVRMGADTSFAFTTLDNDAMRMRLSVGVLNLRVRSLGENEAVEIETPQTTASILRPGSYRLEVNPDGATTVVKVSSGMIEARGAANQSFVVRAQEVATLTGTNQLAFSTATLGAPDEFDQWALERDRQDDYALSTEPARNVPSDIVGYEDLDKYGTWTSEPDYGYVWTPSYVSAGWSPYGVGSYTFVNGWGWAWITNTPWGFAPYHYGTWVTIGSRWCWVPGPRHGRPIGRPVGRPGVGRPSQPPHHGWHVPRPPRGYTVRSGVPGSDATRIVTRPGFDADDLARRESWREHRGTAQNNGGRFHTVPDPVPRVTPTPRDDARLRTPRYEIPRNPRSDSRAGGTYRPPTYRAPQPSRPITSRPAPSRPVQSRPAPSRPVQSRPVQVRPAPAPARSSAGINGSGGMPRASRTR